jgi:hypothetical protein
VTNVVDTSANLLRRAREQIQQHGWSPYDLGERLCIFSALGMVTFGRRVIDMSEAEMTALDRTVRFVSDVIGGLEVIEWEQTRGRNQGDVLGALARAAERAEWDDNAPEAA